MQERYSFTYVYTFFHISPWSSYIHILIFQQSFSPYTLFWLPNLLRSINIIIHKQLMQMLTYWSTHNTGNAWKDIDTWYSYNTFLGAKKMKCFFSNSFISLWHKTYFDSPFRYQSLISKEISIQETKLCTFTVSENFLY